MKKLMRIKNIYKNCEDKQVAEELISVFKGEVVKVELIKVKTSNSFLGSWKYRGILADPKQQIKLENDYRLSHLYFLEENLIHVSELGKVIYG